jgi:two-component system LytT family response regulator
MIQPLPTETASSASNALFHEQTGACPVFKGMNHSPAITCQNIEDLCTKTKDLLRHVNEQALSNHLVGIPTIEGIEFFKAAEIIRCEGMQRLTKVFVAREAIISSYNIGEFCRLLYDCGFFSPHKSHLINLQYLRSYHICGAITLRDGSRVPLARRRREAFLERVRHL